MITDLAFLDAGFQLVHTNRITDLASGGHTGIDPAFVKGGVCYIVETKYNGGAFNKSTTPGQMTKGWVYDRNAKRTKPPTSSKCDDADLKYIGIKVSIQSDLSIKIDFVDSEAITYSTSWTNPTQIELNTYNSKIVDSTKRTYGN